MPVFLLADIDVHDQEMYRQYVERARPIVKRYGGRYHIQGGAVTPMSGDWTPQRLILIEFDHLEALQRCFASPEYKAIAPLREQATRSRSIIVEGCDGDN